MSCFLKSEKPRQAAFKQTSRYFSEAARADGLYQKSLRPFCIPRDHADENLMPQIRKTASAYFTENEIKWHEGQDAKPSNHLCSSQVCCVNFLFPFADQPDALGALLRPIFPDIKYMLPIEYDEYVAFEWIGQENYLGEKIARNGKRTRGANCTSADAAVRFERADGTIQVVLIEWKYTESYGEMSLVKAQSGTDRTEIYRPLFEQADCPLDKALLPEFDALFYAPFYQLMRQQLLAHEMEKAQELGASRVSVLHIAPAANLCFQRVTSKRLAGIGDGVTEIWGKLVRTPGRFVSVSTERMFGDLLASHGAELVEWADYIGARYGWTRT